MPNAQDQPSLFELPTEDVYAEAKRRKDATAEIDRAMGPGPVYQGMGTQIRRLTAKGKRFSHLKPVIDPDEHAGTIAALRALAKAIDKVTGHNPTGWVASGRDISPMLTELRELLRMVMPDTEADPLEEWLKDGDEAKADDRV